MAGTGKPRMTMPLPQAQSYFPRIVIPSSPAVVLMPNFTTMGVFVGVSGLAIVTICGYLAAQPVSDTRLVLGVNKVAPTGFVNYCMIGSSSTTIGAEASCSVTYVQTGLSPNAINTFNLYCATSSPGGFSESTGVVIQPLDPIPVG